MDELKLLFVDMRWTFRRMAVGGLAALRSDVATFLDAEEDDGNRRESAFMKEGQGACGLIISILQLCWSYIAQD